jgi:transcriptional regulator with XRE-family HTH domain
MPKRPVTRVDVHVGKRLRALREAKGLSQVKIARMLGVAYQQVQKYESGVNRLSLSSMMTLAQLFDVPINYFYDGAPAPTELRSSTKRAAPVALENDGVDQLQLLIEAFGAIHDPGGRQKLVSLAQSLAAPGHGAVARAKSSGRRN